MRVRSLKDIKELKNKRVLVRVDYNLSFIDGKLDFEDDLRIRASLKTIKYLLGRGATVILAAHLGRPEGWDKKLTLAPIAKHLAKLLRKGINFIADDLTKKDISKKIRRGANMLENIRFYEGEGKNDKSFAKRLAGLADIYVNEGFSVSHRRESSVSGIQKFLPSYAGLNFEAEILNLSRLLPKNIKKQNRPYVAALGGVKISTKIGLLRKLLKYADYVLAGGALVNNLLKFKGYKLGASLTEEVPPGLVKKILKSKKLVLPRDFVVGDDHKIYTIRLAATKHLCRAKEKILDIGPETILEFSRYIKTARTILWNGPMGYFENPAFAYGTMSVARLVASRGRGRAYAVVGGGETIAALNLTKMEKYVDWVSTGGGAMLAYLAGEKMPGLEKILK